MTAIASQIVTLGPVGRLPWRLGFLLADLLALALALAAHQAGFIVYAAVTTLFIFGSAALLSGHARALGRQSLTPLAPRLAGGLVALAAGAGPLWMICLILAGYVLLGQIGFPPLSWFIRWLPEEAAQVADDVLAGLALLLVATLFTL